MSALTVDRPQHSCLYFWQPLESFCRSLFALFQKTLFCCPQGSSLADRQIKIGGVENTGNSCIFSVMLQDFACLPQVYDVFLQYPLQKSDEEDEQRYQNREALRQSLYRSIVEIRSGVRVEKKEIEEIASHLQTLGWTGNLGTLWQRFLHWVAPCIFSLPQFSAYELYEKTLALLVAGQSSEYQIVFLQKEDVEISFPQFFANRTEVQKCYYPLLWRVTPKEHRVARLDTSFVVNGRQFSLKCIHAYQETSSGKHVIAYRPYEGQAVCCDDTSISAVETLPLDHLYTLVYESLPPSY